MALVQQKQDISRVLQQSMLSACRRVVPYNESLELHGLLQLEVDGLEFCTVSFKNVRATERQDSEEIRPNSEQVHETSIAESSRIKGSVNAMIPRSTGESGKHQERRKSWDPFKILKPKENKDGKYECLICGRQFSHGTNLTRHQRSSHGRPQIRNVSSSAKYSTCSRKAKKRKKPNPVVQDSSSHSDGDNELNNNNQEKDQQFTESWSHENFDSNVENVELNISDSAMLRGVVNTRRSESTELNQSNTTLIIPESNFSNSDTCQSTQNSNNVQANLSGTLWNHFSGQTSGSNVLTSSSSSIYNSPSMVVNTTMATTETNSMISGHQVSPMAPLRSDVAQAMLSGQLASFTTAGEGEVPHQTYQSLKQSTTSQCANSGTAAQNVGKESVHSGSWCDTSTATGNPEQHQVEKNTDPDTSSKSVPQQEKYIHIASSGNKYVSLNDMATTSTHSPKYRCPKCDRYFAFFRNLGRHAKVTHKMSVLELGNLNMVDELNSEQATSNKHVCDICRRSFKHLPNLYRHKSKLHGIKFKKQNTTKDAGDTGGKKAIQNCEKMNSESRDAQSVPESKKAHRLVCDLCSIKFSCSSSLSRHMRRTHKLMRVESSTSSGKRQKKPVAQKLPVLQPNDAGQQERTQSEPPSKSKQSTPLMPFSSSSTNKTVAGVDEASTNLLSTGNKLEVLQKPQPSKLDACAQASKHQNHTQNIPVVPQMYYNSPVPISPTPLPIQHQVSLPQTTSNGPSQNSGHHDQRRSLPLPTTSVEGPPYHDTSATPRGKPGSSKKSRGKHQNRNSDPLPVRLLPQQILPSNLPQATFQGENSGMVQRTPYRTVSEHDLFTPVPTYLSNPSSRYGTLPMSGGIRPMDGTPSVAVSQVPYTGRDLTPADNRTFMYPSSTSLPETWSTQQPHQHRMFETGNPPSQHGQKVSKKEAKSKGREAKYKSKGAKSRNVEAKPRSKEAKSSGKESYSSGKEAIDKHHCKRCRKTLSCRSNFTRHMKNFHNTVPDC